MKKNIFMLFVVVSFLALAGLALAQADQSGPGQRPMMGPGQGQNQRPGMGQGQQGQNQGDRQGMGPNAGQKQGDKAQPGQKKGQGPKENQPPYGQPIMMDNGRMQENPNMFGFTTSSTSTRERIAHPGEIGNYTQITKSGNAMYGIRKPGAPKLAFIDASKAPCVKTAISNRDAAVRTAILGQQQAMLAAMDARTTCDLAALDKASAQEQSDANKACIEADQKARDAANTQFESARNNAQAAFQTAVRSCLGLPPMGSATSTPSTTGN